jgi:hypothetical protein
MGATLFLKQKNCQPKSGKDKEKLHCCIVGLTLQKWGTFGEALRPAPFFKVAPIRSRPLKGHFLRFAIEGHSLDALLRILGNRYKRSCIIGLTLQKWGTFGEA